MNEMLTTGTKVKGDIISPGALFGRLCFLDDVPRFSEKADMPVKDTEREVVRFEKQVGTVVEDLQKIESSLRDSLLDAEADIVHVHITLLTEPQFHQRVHQQIRDNHLNAHKAADIVVHDIMDRLEASNTWLSERTADFRDILNRLQARLSQKNGTLVESLAQVDSPIIAVHELLPSLVLEARLLKQCAFVVEKGTTTSHAAILAKSFGIPAVRVDNLGRLRAHGNEAILVDAMRGMIIAGPTETQVKEVLGIVHAGPVPNRSSSWVRLWINITDPLQVRPEVLLRVDGIGLYRTEVLFMTAQGDFPSEEAQYQVYRRLFDACGNVPVTVRTADIGGDKMLPYFSLGPQENPYLGLRAHRIYRFHPDILVTQLRALLRAAPEQARLRIMYPMIEDIEELRFVQSLLSRAADSLKHEGAPYKENFLQGIMVEVPSAAWDFDELLQRVDFASVGTNDLLQYFMAADRNNSNIAPSYRPLSPAFLKMLRALVVVAEHRSKSLSICGEIASNRSLIPLLIGMGFKDISVSLHALADVEDCLSNLHREECRRLADACLQCQTSEEVRVVLREFGHEPLPAPKSLSVAAHEAVDPVCNVVVHAASDSFTAGRHGKQYYFCSARCRDEFISWQEGDDEH